MSNIPKRAWTYIDRVYDKCNLLGYDVNIYDQIFRYKVLRELDDDQIEYVYDYIAKRLGMM